jgi:hypothetical protein
VITLSKLQFTFNEASFRKQDLQKQPHLIIISD